MDTRTGEIGNYDEMAKRVPKKHLQPLFDHTPIGGIFKPLLIEYLSIHVQKMLLETGHAQIGRNSKCPCGSRKRFKRCCMTKGNPI